MTSLFESGAFKRSFLAQRVVNTDLIHEMFRFGNCVGCPMNSAKNFVCIVDPEKTFQSRKIHSHPDFESNIIKDETFRLSR